ncbi:MAG: Mur ligase family protein [Cytophagales bacterium]|nr:Mur ligase family protein [Cytophagales bacterium]
MQVDPFQPIFRSFVERKNPLRIADALVRVPELFRASWEADNIVPAAEKLILVTGSKGKGTVARQIAWNLQANGFRVGLVLSPEEKTHLDRIRFNNHPIHLAPFEAYLHKQLPDLEARLRGAPPQKYLSPTGIFLTVALHYFAQTKPDWIVIEGGRGVLWDEIGQLRARMGIITTLLPEHLTELGGSFEAVIRDKMRLSLQVQQCFCGPQAWLAIESHPSFKAAYQATPSLCGADLPPSQPKLDIGNLTKNYPAWFAQLSQLSQEALHALIPHGTYQSYPTPSFGFVHTPHGQLWYESVIHHLSLDPAFIRTHIASSSCIVIGLTPDKDAASIEQTLRLMGFKEFFFFHISWHPTTDEQTIDVIHPDTARLHATLSKLIEQHQSVYAIGIQTFIRSIRLAFKL